MEQTSHVLTKLDANREAERLLVQALALLLMDDGERRQALRRAMDDGRARGALAWLAEEITIVLLMRGES